jgi:two-component system, chemotaxis family, protein-glutamate methylesterase/glutaminase
VVKGPRENKYRPALDPIFRSAAVSFSNRVIGVILTGMLEDGTAGMQAVKRCGGTTIVQDPEEAFFSDMPTIVKKTIHVDYTLTLIEINKKLPFLIEKAVEGTVEIPEDLILENDIALRHFTGKQVVEQLGELSPFTCPDCGGSLWQRDVTGIPQLRCHAGHSYNASRLLKRKSEGLEESFWVSLRLLEEKKNLLILMAENYKGSPNDAVYRNLRERIEEANTHISRIRKFLFYQKKN